MFENGGRRTTDDGRTDDGRTSDHGHPISSPCEPDGSGELKTGIYVCRQDPFMHRNKLVDELRNQGGELYYSWSYVD